jgi:hypothetical protein
MPSLLTNRPLQPSQQTLRPIRTDQSRSNRESDLTAHPFGQLSASLRTPYSHQSRNLPCGISRTQSEQSSAFGSPQQAVSANHLFAQALAAFDLRLNSINMIHPFTAAVKGTNRPLSRFAKALMACRFDTTDSLHLRGPEGAIFTLRSMLFGDTTRCRKT